NARIDDRSSRRPPGRERIEEMRRRGQRLVVNFDTANQPAWIAWIAKANRFAAGSECGEVTAGIHHTTRHFMVPQNIDRPIDGETVGNASKIDSAIRMMKTNAVLRKQLDLCRCREPVRAERSPGLRTRKQASVLWKQTQVLQDRRDGDVESTRRAPMEIERGFEDREGPGVHADRTH